MYLVSLVLQVDVFLICLHLHLLHLALQLAVCLLQVIVVPEAKAPRDHIIVAASVTQHLAFVLGPEIPSLKTTGKVI